MGPGGDGAEVKIHKVHMVRQKDIGGLEALHMDLFDLIFLAYHAQAAQGPEDSGKNFPLAQGRPGGVVAFEAAVVDIDVFHKVFPPLGHIPERILPFLPVYHRNNRKANPISGNFQHDFQKGGCQKRAGML